MLAFLASLILVSSGDSTSPRPIAQLVHTRWAARDGAPTDIYSLAQTSDGYLWIGTLTGLFRFDGVRFVPFVPRAGDTLAPGGTRSLLAARDGSLWIGSRTGGISRLRDGRLVSYGARDGLPVVFRLAEPSTGMLVAGTAKGLARFSDGTWKDAGRDWGFPGKESRSLWFDRGDTLWVETEDRVVYLPAGGHRFVDPGMPLGGTAGTADFAQARDGSIWMAELSRSAHTMQRLGDQYPVTQVKVGTWALVIDRKGSLWIGSAGDGLRRVLDPARIQGRTIAQFGPEAEQFTEKDGLQSNVVNALLEDREGNVWVGTNRGLERFREGAFTPFPTPGSVRSRFVFASRDSSIWTGAYNEGGMLRLSGRRAGERIGGSLVHSTLAEDSSGVLWIVDGGKIYRIRGGELAPVQLTRSDALQLVEITIDREGTVWVYDQTLGLLRLAHDSLVRVVPVFQPGFTHVNLLADREGRIWIGEQNRVALYDHGHVREFAISQMQGFLEDRAGNLWVAGEHGLSKFEDGSFRTLRERQGLPGRSVYAIIQDQTEAMWIVVRAGMLRVPAGEFDRALADSNHVVRYRLFDQQDGMPGLIPATPWGPRLARAPDGRIWVATDSGVASVDPRLLQSSPAPQVLIEAARVNGRELFPSDTIAIPPGGRDLEIDYTATSLSIPERTQFRYRLEGQDPDWRDVGPRRRAYYSGLGPGAYRFRVIASDADGNWNEAGAVLAFRVLPAWYQTLWFYAGVALLIGGLGALAAVLVQRRRHQTLKGRYEATLAERARIAQDLHDTLLQGFAGVTLQLKAAELALPDEPDVAAETILRVQQLARSSLREARERVWDMRGTELGADDLPAALEALARERTGGSGVEVSVVSSGRRRRLTRPVEDAAFRVGREAIVNAVRHAEARRIDIHVEFGSTTLRLEVRDDGRGFTPVEGEEARRRGHFGLTGMRERAASCGGRCDVSPGAGGGTIVTLVLPNTPNGVLPPR